MLMSITLNQDEQRSYQASDLGFLLHKHPDRVHQFELSYGRALVFYPESGSERCTATVHQALDGIDLVRGFKGPKGSARQLSQYVNDRPYTINSFFSVAISRLFGTALNGTCHKQPELVKRELPFEVHLPVLPSRGGESLIRNLFEPLGYEVNVSSHLYDEQIPEWGMSPYFEVTIGATKRLADVLRHLYVLMPVLDNDKHYWVGFDEVDKLIDKGGDWLPQHPEKNLIVARYLKKQGSLKRKALAAFEVSENDVKKQQDQLIEQDDESRSQADEDRLEKHVRLNDLRIEKITQIINQLDVRNVVDLGCGEGKYLKAFLKINKLDEITGVEVAPATLEKAEQRLKVDRLPERIRNKLHLLQGSLTYKDDRLKNKDLATCIEVIEHIDEDRLDAFKASVFDHARPRYVIITTPNVEYNVLFENMPVGKLRHSDHRFEWDRKTFESWCQTVCSTYEYEVSFDTIGEVHPEYGAPTQMALFTG
jgi:3' terminal RNA ribose 2'-O-methyltransferase Hen1